MLLKIHKFYKKISTSEKYFFRLQHAGCGEKTLEHIYNMWIKNIILNYIYYDINVCVCLYVIFLS